MSSKIFLTMWINKLWSNLTHQLFSDRSYLQMWKPGWTKGKQIGCICYSQFVVRIRCPPLISGEVINVQASINPKIFLIVLSQQFCPVTRAISHVTRKLKLVENWSDVLSRIIKSLFLAYCDRGIIQFSDIEWMGHNSNPYNEEVINFTFWVFLKNISHS